MPPGAQQLEVDRSVRSSGIVIEPDIPICQSDLPLDWYQEEFKPYAEEYLALADRKPETVLPWMDRYIHPALDHFGPGLMLLAHYYMGGEIVKLVERYGGKIADSYLLARQAVLHAETRVFVESAVHFMAESIAILAAPEQEVYITNPKAGCTMEMMAKEFMVAPGLRALQERYGDDLTVVAYMNTSGRIKALAGRTGGAVCTSSNAPAVLRWAFDQGRKVLFVPDRHLGENTAAKLGVPPDRIFLWAGGHEGGDQRLADLGESAVARLDRADLLLWDSFCGVHTVFQPEHVSYWKERGYTVLIHPESPKPAVDAADGSGSTHYLWHEVIGAAPGRRSAIGTEGHFVRTLAEQSRLRDIEVVHLADVPDLALQGAGCGCATMSRNDPPHLVAILDLLRQGKAPDLNRVLAGDVVDEVTGYRERLDAEARADVAANARKALQRMIEITEAAASSRPAS
jgi:quinolinate synthase